MGFFVLVLKFLIRERRVCRVVVCKLEILGCG
jgi:hypothetical protein